MGNRLKTIAIDDEFRALEVIERYAVKVPFLEWKGSFKNPVEGLSYLSTAHVDLLFLDINMPELSGTSLAKLIKPDQQIIFTTAYSEYAVEGFDLNATDYLLKPIEFDRFLKACLKAQHHIHSPVTSLNPAHPGPEVSQKHFLTFKSGTKLHRILVEDILFFEKQRNNMLVHVVGGESISTRINMKALFGLLPLSRFCQTHKSFVVAIDKIDTIESHQVVVEGHQIPIGRSYRELFLSRLQS